MPRTGAPLILAAETADPTTDGGLTYRSDTGRFRGRMGGVVVDLGHAIEPYVLHAAGTLTATTGVLRLPTAVDYVVESVTAAVATAPTGASVIIDVNDDGTTIYGTQTARPTIAAGTTSATGGTPTAPTITGGSLITVDIDQIGSTVAGANLVVVIRLRRA